MTKIEIDRILGKGKYANYKVEIDTSKDPVLVKITDPNGEKSTTRLPELIEGCEFLEIEVYKSSTEKGEWT